MQTLLALVCTSSRRFENLLAIDGMSILMLALALPLASALQPGWARPFQPGGRLGLRIRVTRARNKAPGREVFTVFKMLKVFTVFICIKANTLQTRKGRIKPRPHVSPGTPWLTTATWRLALRRWVTSRDRRQRGATHARG